MESPKFSFGRHKGRSYKDVISSNPEYVAWALKQVSPGGALKQFVDYIATKRTKENTQSTHDSSATGDCENNTDEKTLECEREAPHCSSSMASRPRGSDWSSDVDPKDCISSTVNSINQNLTNRKKICRMAEPTTSRVPGGFDLADISLLEFSAKPLPFESRESSGILSRDVAPLPCNPKDSMEQRTVEKVCKENSRPKAQEDWERATSPRTEATALKSNKQKRPTETLNYELSIEISSYDSFRVLGRQTKTGVKCKVPLQWHSVMPIEAGNLLEVDCTRLPSSTRQSPIFPASEYRKVLQALKGLSCPVEVVPDYVLHAFPAFSVWAGPICVPRRTALVLGGQRQFASGTGVGSIDTEANEFPAWPDDIAQKYVGSKLLSSLRKFQSEGVRYVVAHAGRGLIGDEMGLGKTLQALAIAAYYSEDWPLLIVCPSSLRLQWEQQTTTWLSHLVESFQVFVIKSGKVTVPRGSKVIIVSYDLLAKQPRFQAAFRCIICDESHYLKNTEAKRSQVVVSLLSKAKRCVLLSGTPALNRPAELYPQVAAVMPDYTSMTGFCNRYSEKSFNRYSRKMEYTQFRHSKELHLWLTQLMMIRRLKRDVMSELPVKQRSKVPVECAKKDLEEMKNQLSQVPGGQKLCEALSNESTAGGASLGGSSPLSKVFSLTGQAKATPVQEYVSEFLGNNDNVKCLVFGHHMVMLDSIEELAKTKRWHYVRIDGSVAMEARNQRVADFQNREEIKIAILSITACGVGLNLAAANTVIFAEMFWVPGLMLQAEDRCHRIGATHRNVDIYYLVAKETIDEVIWNILHKKWENLTTTLDGKAEHLCPTAAVKTASSGCSSENIKLEKFFSPQS